MDSGVGGLSILRKLQALMPHEDFFFIGDQAHVPYGPRSTEEIYGFVAGIVQFFLEGNNHATDILFRRTKLIVVACNTATTRTIQRIRSEFPQVRFIGIEPAIKPAAKLTNTGNIGVIGTYATLNGAHYANLVDRFARHVKVHSRPSPELVELVERGGDFTAEDHQMIRDALAPLIEANIDQLALACTHFPFLIDAIAENVGHTINIIDPSPAVARHTRNVLEQAKALTTHITQGRTIYTTTGELSKFRSQLNTLLGLDAPDAQQLRWQHDQLIIPEPL
jgi:glutamate racemase